MRVASLICEVAALRSLNLVHETPEPRPFMLNAIVDGVSIEQSQSVAEASKQEKKSVRIRRSYGESTHHRGVCSRSLPPSFTWRVVSFLLLSLMQMKG